MKRALVIYCHPLTGSFTEAMRDRVLAGLSSADAEVRLTDLYADGFEPGQPALDDANHDACTGDPSLRRHAEDLAWCDTLILVYPTWWSGQPSMLVGWIERVWVGGSQESVPRRRNVKRLIAVTSHGSTKLINMVEGEAGKYTLTRSMRASCHSGARATWIALYAIDSSTAAQRESFLRRVERRIANLA